MLSKMQGGPRPETKKSGGGDMPDTQFLINNSKTDWKKRLSSLDVDKQKQIALKYYGGHMPWKE